MQLEKGQEDNSGAWRWEKRRTGVPDRPRTGGSPAVYRPVRGRTYAGQGGMSAKNGRTGCPDKGRTGGQSRKTGGLPSCPGYVRTLSGTPVRAFSSFSLLLLLCEQVYTVARCA